MNARRAVEVARRRIHARSGAGDAGITMVEVVVSTIVMAFALAMFLTSMLEVLHTANHNQALSQAQMQVNQTFLRLDTQIRYASAISQDGTGPVDGDPYVEFLLSNSGAATGTCNELRLDAGQLQWRSWTWQQGGTFPSPKPGWTTLVSNVSATQPFTFKDTPDMAHPFQQLEINITVGTSSKAGSSRRNDVTFTALNTTYNSQNQTTTTCTEGRSNP